MTHLIGMRQTGIIDPKAQPGGVWLFRKDGFRVKCVDYDDAYARAGTGDTIFFYNGAYSFTTHKSVTKAITIQGQSASGVTLTNSVANNSAFDVAVNNVTFRDLTIVSTGASTKTGCISTENTIILENCTLNKSSGAATTGYSMWLYGGAATLTNCTLAVTAGTSKYALYNTDAAATVTINGGTLTGATADIFGNQAGSTLNLNGCTLTNAIADWAGTKRGQALDQYGRRLRVKPAGINAVRLTPSTGVPVETANVTGAANVYATPFLGSAIEVFNGYLWIEGPFDEISVAVPSTKYRLFDVFVYDNSGALALETVNWNLTTGSITGATNATPIVVTSNSHGLSVGNVVAIDGVLGNTATNGKWYVTAVTTNTFTLGGSVGNGAYTSGGTWYKLNGVSRATALALQDGRYTKSGDATRLYLGTVRTDATSGQTSDTSAGLRLLWNYFNRRRKVVSNSDTTVHTYDSTFRPYNGLWSTASVEYVIGVVEAITHCSLNASIAFVSGGSSALIGIGFNVNTAANIQSNLSIAGTLRIDYCEFEAFPGAGFNYVSCVESGSNTGADPTFNNYTLTASMEM